MVENVVLVVEVSGEIRTPQIIDRYLCFIKRYKILHKFNLLIKKYYKQLYIAFMLIKR